MMYMILVSKEGKKLSTGNLLAQISQESLDPQGKISKGPGQVSRVPRE